MGTSAEMSCVMKVNIHCDECRMKVLNILQNLCGVCSVVVDGGEGEVKMRGTISPDIILRAIEGSGKHGKVKRLTFNGDIRVRASGYDNYIPYEAQYPQYYFPCSGPQYLPYEAHYPHYYIPGSEYPHYTSSTWYPPSQQSFRRYDLLVPPPPLPTPPRQAPPTPPSSPPKVTPSPPAKCTPRCCIIM